MVKRGALLITVTLALVTLALVAHPPPVYGAYGDPPLGSPSGAVYQLPLEQGRSDAAPKGSAPSPGHTAGQGTQGSGTSLYRSENNFGSSSQVPGLPGPGGGPGGGPSGGPGTGSPGGGGAVGAGAAGLGGGALASATALDSGNTSVPGSVALLGAMVLFTAAIGFFSSRAARHAH